MPYNYLGDLRKSEIVSQLNSMGCNIKNVHELNLILEKMGILKHYDNGWATTELGEKYAFTHRHVIDCEAWHPSIVNAIYSYLTEQIK